MFVGQRPLIGARSHRATQSLSREHVILVSPSQLITIAGGKWTTYRRMGEEVINIAAKVGSLKPTSCVTAQLHLYGWTDTLLTETFESDSFTEVIDKR